MKTTLIAGATSMIGRAAARILNQAGHSLILLGKDEPALKNMRAETKAPCYSYDVDFSDTDKLQEAMLKITSEHQIDALIYNVAIYPWKLIENITQKEFLDTIQVTLNGAFTITKSLIPSFKEQKSGKIVYISSLAGEIQGTENMAAYSAGKAGLNGFMRTCAAELAPFNVNVNSILPGKVYDSNTLTDLEKTEKLSNVPLKRFVEPVDIAYMAEYLISEKARNITGQTLTIDAGQSIF